VPAEEAAQTEAGTTFTNAHRPVGIIKKGKRYLAEEG
jgi:hypothetical protein